MEVVSSPQPVRRAPASSVAVTAPSAPPQQQSTSQYQLTELKNVQPAKHVVNQQQFQNEDEFLRRLICAVRGQPCLYDAAHEHYGNKHASAQHRAAVWQQLCRQLQYGEDAHSLQMHWKRLRDRYVRRRRRSMDQGVEEPPPYKNLLDEMRWMDQYIGEVVSVPPPSQQPHTPSAAREMYYLQQGHDPEDALMAGYEDDYSIHSSHATSTINGHPTPKTAPSIARAAQNPAGSPHSTCSDVSVGSAGGVPVAHPGPAHSSSAPIVRTTQSMQQQQKPGTMTVMAGGSGQKVQTTQVQITGRGNVGGMVKKDGAPGGTLTMIIDPTMCYQNGSQKMYRLVNVSELDHNVHIQPQSISAAPPRRKRIALHVQQSPTHGQQHHQPPPQQQQPSSSTAGISVHPTPSHRPAPSAPPPLTPTSSNPGQLGEELILEDGIVERTIVIDPSEQHSPPLLADSPMSSVMISGHSVHAPRHAIQHLPQQSQQQRSAHVPSPSFSAAPIMRHTPNRHHQPLPPPPAYSHQTQYDADLQFQNLISTALSRLNEDDKAVMKMNIQRILLDARFGAGFCSRMIQDEELSEAAGNSVVGHHEMVPSSL